MGSRFLLIHLDAGTRLQEIIDIFMPLKVFRNSAKLRTAVQDFAVSYDIRLMRDPRVSFAIIVDDFGFMFSVTLRIFAMRGPSLSFEARIVGFKFAQCTFLKSPVRFYAIFDCPIDDLVINIGVVVGVTSL